MLYDTKKPVKIAETVFDVFYLCFVLVAVCYLLASPIALESPKWMFGLATLLLLLGDASHLIPRIFMMWNENSKLAPALGIGKMATSITITLFYLILWYIGNITFEMNFDNAVMIIVFSLAFIRILLCVLPQNKWITDEATFAWGIIRNIPFILLGIIVIIQYKIGSDTLLLGEPMSGPPDLWIAIIISFIFYIPVLFFAKKYRAVGMLMLPKSCAYIVIIVMGALFFPSILFL